MRNKFNHSIWFSWITICCGLLTAVELIGELQAQEPLPVRKLYVPEEFPAEWPRGDWRPMSTRRFLELSELWGTDKSDPTTPPVSEVAYECEFSEGKLQQGTLKLKTQRQQSQGEWLNIGQTNLVIDHWSGEVEKPLWGTGQDGNLYLFQTSATAEWQAEWQKPGVPVSEAYRFDLQLLPSLQSHFIIRLPDHLALVLAPRPGVGSAASLPPLFRKEVKPGLLEWTIQGLHQEQLSFTIEPVVRMAKSQRILSRQIHQVTVSPSEQTFVSDFKLEWSNQPLNEVQIVLPSVFQVDSVQLQQETLTSWNVSPLPESARQEQIVNIALPQNSRVAQQGTLRLRGILREKKKAQLSTSFPQLRNTLNLETQVNLVVQSPYTVELLEASGLKQIDARLVTGVRDVWSYNATTADPHLKLNLAIPAPELTIEQAILVQKQDAQPEVHHVMLWSTRSDRLFESSFYVSSGYAVKDVTVPGQFISPSSLTWSVQQQEGRDVLKIQLANQLVPEQKFPIAVSLIAKQTADSSALLKLPAITPVTARLRQSLLITQGLTIENVEPENSVLADVTPTELKVWSPLKQLPLTPTGTMWQADWSFKNMTAANRVYVLPEASLAPTSTSSSTSLSQPELKTELHTRNGLLAAHYQIRIPADQQRIAGQLRVYFSDPAPLLKWNAAFDGKSSADSIQPAVEMATDHVGKEYYLLQWNGNSSADQSLLFESQWSPVEGQASRIPPLPVLEDSIPYQGKIFWHPDQLSLTPREAVNGSKTLTEWIYHSANELNGLAVEVHSPPNGLSIPEKSLQWSCTIHAIVHQRLNTNNRVWVEYRAPKPEGTMLHHEIRFASEVTVHRILINEQSLPVERKLTTLNLPSTAEPVRSLMIEYSFAGDQILLLPQPEFAVQPPRLMVCLPSTLDPLPKGEVIHWQPIPPAAIVSQLSAAIPGPILSALQPASLTPVPKQMSSDSLKNDVLQENHPVPTAAETAFLELTSKQNYQIYRGFVTSPLSDQITIVTAPVDPSPFMLVSLLGISFLICLGLTLTFRLPPQVWMVITALLLTASLVMKQPEVTRFLTPLAIACLLILHLTPLCLKWTEQLQQSPESTTKTKSALLGVLFKGSLTLMITCWMVVPSTSVSGQQTSTSTPSATPDKSDILIPVPAAQLNKQFKGLSIDQYPDVIYVTAELADKLTAKAATSQSLNQILIQSARYEATWNAQSQLKINCVYEVIDPDGASPRSRLFLPIRNINAISALKALVNQQAVNISPLPDGSGLEIPLPSEQLTTEQPAPTDPLSAEAINRSVRRYRIELDVIPIQQQTTRAIKSELAIPAVINTRLQITPREEQNLQFQINSKDWLPIPSENPVEASAITIGNLSSLNFSAQDAPVPATQNVSRRYQSLDAEMLCKVYEHHAELQMNVTTTFQPDAESTMLWQLPAGMIFRNLHSVSSIEQQLQDGPEETSKLKLTFLPHKGDQHSVLMNFILPIPSDNSELMIPLPQLLDLVQLTDDELKWQIGLQSQPGAQLTAIEFPEAASSRISLETFLSTWPDQNSLQDNVQCFRVKMPTRIKALSKQVLPEMTVSAEHRYVRVPKTVELISVYRGQMVESQLWTISFLTALPWELANMKATVDGQEIPARHWKSHGIQEVSLADEVSGTFELRIRWRLPDTFLVEGANFSPPRIAQAVLTQESIVFPQEEFAGLLLSVQKEDDQNNFSSTTELSGLKLQADSPYLLPETILTQATVPPAAPKTHIESDTTEKLNPPPVQTVPEPNTPASEQTGRISNEQVTVSPDQIKIDHTIWIDRDWCFGETLIVYDQPLESSSSAGITLNLPAQMETLQKYHSGRVEAVQSAQEMSITFQPATPPALFQTRYLLLQWKLPRTVWMAGEEFMPLPKSPEAGDIHWRVFERKRTGGTARQISADAQDSWKQMLDRLAELGALSDASALMDSTALTVDSPFVIENPLLNQWPEECRNYFQTLSVEMQIQIQRGQLRLPGQSWVNSSPANFAISSQAGNLQESSRIPLVVDWDACWRYAVIAVICLWGLGYAVLQRSGSAAVALRSMTAGSAVLIGMLLVRLIIQ